MVEEETRKSKIININRFASRLWELFLFSAVPSLSSPSPITRESHHQVLVLIGCLRTHKEDKKKTTKTMKWNEGINERETESKKKRNISHKLVFNVRSIPFVIASFAIALCFTLVHFMFHSCMSIWHFFLLIVEVWLKLTRKFQLIETPNVKLKSFSKFSRNSKYFLPTKLKSLGMFSLLKWIPLSFLFAHFFSWTIVRFWILFSSFLSLIAQCTLNFAASRCRFF